MWCGGGIAAVLRIRYSASGQEPLSLDERQGNMGSALRMGEGSHQDCHAGSVGGTIDCVGACGNTSVAEARMSLLVAAEAGMSLLADAEARMSLLAVAGVPRRVGLVCFYMVART